MKRTIFVLALLVATAATLSAQDSGQADAQNSPYAGVSHPPADDTITTSSIPQPKPPAGLPGNAQPDAQAVPQQVYEDPAGANATPASPAMNLPAPVQAVPRPSSVDPSANFPSPESTDGTDGGVVRMAPYRAPAPGLQSRYGYDPDGDIVHPHPLRAGELQEGTSIRVHLLDRLTTSEAEKGQPFRTRVATDVLEGGQVVIPAGAEIDGRVVQVSAGSIGGHGTMRLDPDSIIMPNGERFHLRAAVTGAPGTGSRVVGEGTIRPGSRARRDGIEYGGAVGSGVVVGAIVAGPAGALTGGLIGAGAVTVHLLVSHPQATLETGSTLILQLTDRLYLAPELASGN